MPWISKRPPSVEGCYCVGLDIAVTSIGLLYAPTFNGCWYKYDPLVFFFLSLSRIINIILFLLIARVIPPFVRIFLRLYSVGNRSVVRIISNNGPAFYFIYIFFSPPCWRIDPVGTHPRRNSHRTVRNSGDHWADKLLYNRHNRASKKASSI